jgi:aminoglycoside phosphotransferase (APT) family kinase protein
VDERIEWKRIPEDLVARAADRATGSAPTNVTRLFVSYSNDVYDVDGSFIVRAHRDDPRHFDRERWALVQAAAAGVPVPEVLLLEDAEVGGALWSVCVQTKLAGVPLIDLVADRPDTDAYAGVLQEAGVALAGVHSVATTGLGYVDGSGRAPDISSAERLTYRDADELSELAIGTGIEGALVAEACRLVAANVALWDRAPRNLVHGDFSSKHILVEGSQLSGVLDFEFAASGDAAHDIAYWDYQEGYWESTTPLLAGYETIATGAEGLGQRVALLRLCVSLDYIAYHAPKGELTCAFRDHIAERIAADMNRARESLAS